MHQFSIEDGLGTKRGTSADAEAMARMGKSQELERNFQFVSIFGFSMLLMASWEWSLSASTIGLDNGGTAGLIWMFLICWIGFMFINASLAEMSSMAPTSGGQYHWVSELSPRKSQRFFSYLVGWLCVLGWQTSCASSAYLSGTQIQGLLVLNDPEYVSKPWHGTLLTMGVAAFSILFNTALAKKLPSIDGLILTIHVFGFFAILVVLWILSPKTDASIFTQFRDGGYWGLAGSALAGISSGILPLLGGDAAAHIAEEVRDAGSSIPRSIMFTTVVNGLAAWVLLITYCFCVGSQSIEEILATPTGYPYLEVFYNATQSQRGATAMAIIILVMVIFSNTTMVATASRQLFAFSRDQALPFSGWFSSVRYDLPLNAILTTFVSTSLLSTINLGSPTALNSITSLGATGNCELRASD
ncbi:hypothetical protein G7054_g1628 [Neopestalotiopsis clavispora]|nr:hypothetical protein G7054_g1628 [Neopestalotiopsis clavispora]